MLKSYKAHCATHILLKMMISYMCKKYPSFEQSIKRTAGVLYHERKGKKKESEAIGRLAHNCRSLTRLGVILLPLGGRLVHRKSLPKICSWVERGAVGIKCFAEEHNSVSGQGSNPDRSLR